MKKILLVLLSFIGLVSCTREEEPPITGVTEVNYLIGSYFVPQNIYFSREGKGYGSVYVGSKNKITQENNFKEFSKLSKEYGENGKKIFWLTHPPYSHPYGIRSIKVYRLVEGRRKDISDRIKICYKDYSNIILSKYTDMNETFVEKKMSELTPHDLKWFSGDLFMQFETEETEECLFVMELDNGKELTMSIKEIDEPCSCKE